ncbi:hypothetical protein HNP33_003059 [Comamonas odontotermitis]|uniref:Uncharacterized protein n=1 Tax=Comamonas odontotermitis TaxID=379895 RepID=A0ABR6RIH4_9BURK|nr:DUF6682 family protein [Comamonas odontotermitis]MBB6578954.1 hypothetical protein [Comamonas odontotermitis]
MGSIVAQRLIDQASIILQDEKKTRWKQDELLGWLNEAQVQIVNAVPQAYTKTESKKLVEGVLQRAPAGAITVLDLAYNLGTNGATPGKRIRATSRDYLDQSRAKWPADKPQLDVVHFMPDPHIREQFWVWPANTGTGFVLMTYSAVPPDINAGQPIAIPDIYRGAILNWVCFRAHSKDTEAATDSKAASFYQAFVADVGLQQAKPEA